MKKGRIIFLILGIFVAIALCIANIIFACIYKDCGTNIFTAISGWISGIATLLIGVIAFRQSKDYKEENDRFIKYQNDEQWKKMYYDMLTGYIADTRDFEKCLNDFALINNCEMFKDKNINRYFVNFTHYKERTTLSMGLWALRFEKYDELIDALNKYWNYLRDNLDVEKNNIFIETATNLIAEINRCFVFMLADMQVVRSGLVIFDIETSKEKIKQRKL